MEAHYLAAIQARTPRQAFYASIVFFQRATFLFFKTKINKYGNISTLSCSLEKKFLRDFVFQVTWMKPS